MAENERQRLIIMSNFPLINIGIHDLYGSTGFQTASTRRISQENTWNVLNFPINVIFGSGELWSRSRPFVKMVQVQLSA